jgi:hypothetical protein
VKFNATEAGFKNGMGGASNVMSTEEQHYVLFGAQNDSQHPENSGIYFEYDDQGNSAVNSVHAVSIGDKSVLFKLKGGKSIEVNCNLSGEQWEELLCGVRTVFPEKVIVASSNEAQSGRKL